MLSYFKGQAFDPSIGLRGRRLRHLSFLIAKVPELVERPVYGRKSMESLSKSQIFLHGLRKGVFVKGEEDGILAQVLLGAVPVAFVRSSVAPRVLDLVLLVAVLVLGDANN